VLFAYTANFHFFLKTNRVVVASATNTTTSKKGRLAHIALSLYRKPPTLAYTKQTPSSLATVSTRRLTHGQAVPSISSLNDNTNVALHGSRPSTPPAVEVTPVTPGAPLLPLLPHLPPRLPPPLHINPIPALLPVLSAALTPIPIPTPTNHPIPLVHTDSP
jgi:hypothetical protein